MALLEPEEFEEEGVQVPPLEPRVPAAAQTLRQFTVLIDEEDSGGAVPDPAYPAGIFEVASEGEEDPVLVAIIAVADLEGRLLVAVPHSCWHRTTARRVLPTRSLSKAVLVEVPFEDRADDRRDPGKAKIWLGFLAPEFEGAINFETPLENSTLDHTFIRDQLFCLPVAGPLVEIALQQGAFETATSGADPSGGQRPVDQRLARLERSVADIAEGLKKLTAPSDSAPVAPKRPSALRATPKPSGTPCPPPGLSAQLGGGGLDPEVVKSARDAGIPEAHIAQMAALSSKGRSKMVDVPVPARPRKATVLSESEEEEDADTAEEEGGSADNASLVTAVTKLTKIAQHLTARRKKEKGLDAVLDGVGSGMSETSSVVGTRKYAAALRALRRALVLQPEELHRSIEQRMEEDFNLQSQVPGSAGVQMTARAWLEMRSRVQNFQTPVRLLWSIAGILDALRNQKYSEARARACLALAIGDQLSIDRGNWLIAGEMSLEDPPPLGAFSHHPLPQEHEAPFTKLVDGRWVDLFVQKLHDYESLAEKKRKLGAKGAFPPNPPPTGNPAKGEYVKGDPKRKAKAAPKGKGAAGGGQVGEAETTA